MKRILYYIGIILWGSISGAFFADMIAYKQTFTGVVANLGFGFLFAYFVLRCFRGLERNKNKKEVPKVKPEPAPDVKQKNSDELHESLELVQDCLNYKQTMSYPEIENQLTFLSNYLHTFKDKNIEVSHHITEVLNQLLDAYKDIVTTPVKDTPQGKEILLEIENCLVLINSTFSKMYYAILDGQHLEVSSLVQGLKTKLTADGYIGADSPFERRS